MPQQSTDVRPEPQSVPTKVFVNFVVLDVKAIHTSEQTFHVDYFMRLRWKDARLAESNLGRSLAACDIPIDDVWNPQINIDNQEQLSEKLRKVVKVASDGTVSYLQRFTGTLSGSFDLKNYPFDTQTLAITIGSIAYGPNKVVLIFDEASTARSKEFSLVGWTIERSGVASLLGAIDSIAGVP